MGASNSSEGRMPWLQPLWDRKRKDTVVRVTAAVKHLLKKKPITLSTIREVVRLLFQISMSTNTIQRNPEAYATYLQHRTHRPRMQVQNVALRTVLRSVADGNVLSVRARINRLRRESKDTLIAHIIQLENSMEQHVRQQDKLREEILHLTLGSRRKGTDE